MKDTHARWYRRLQVQLWLWAILPVTLVVVAITFTSVRNHEAAMRGFVADRDVTVAELIGQQIVTALAQGNIHPDGSDLALSVTDARIGQRGVIYVVDAQGRVLFHPDAEYVGRDLSTEPLVHQALGGTSGSGEGHWPDGSHTLGAFARVGQTGWHVVVEEPMADVIVPILQFTSILPTLVVIMGVFSLVLIYFSLRTIVRPLQRLSEQAAQITGGDVSGLQQDVGGVEEIRQLHIALRDMAERIRHYQASMRDYIDGITQGQEAERARLSRDLHDETVQSLVAIGQRVQLAQRALEHGEATAATEGLRETRALCQQTLDELRRTIRALRPIYLEDLGFIPALEALATDVREQGLHAELLVEGEPRRLRPEIELAAFRLAQEALNNAVRHAQAQQVTLLVRLEDHALLLMITDDGAGFDPTVAAEPSPEGKHLGLMGMKERVLLLGGQMEIISQPGQGTRINISLPV